MWRRQMRVELIVERRHTRAAFALAKLDALNFEKREMRLFLISKASPRLAALVESGELTPPLF